MQHLSKLFCFILILVFSGTGIRGLESDKDQDIVYSSVGRSTSRIEGGVRIVTLEEDVRVTQGTLSISGDRAVFRSEPDSSAISRVTVDGSPARYSQLLDEDGDFVEGESDAIYYYVEGEPIVEFVGSATLRSANNVLSCASIKYFTDSRFTETTGPCEGISTRATLAPATPSDNPAN